MTQLTLGSHTDCAGADECAPLAQQLHATLATGRYEWPMSLLEIDTIDGYLAQRRTARKRAARAARLGYTFKTIRRVEHVDEIHAINTSTPRRQGRPMTDAYLHRPSFDRLPRYRCSRHRITEHGICAPDGTLVAYLVLYVCGDLALVSQILGHADHLDSDIMYLLAVETFRATLAQSGPVAAVYNRHDSGTDGLRFFKERLGFQAARLEWKL